jgi:hypothetical protein
MILFFVFSQGDSMFYGFLFLQILVVVAVFFHISFGYMPKFLFLFEKLPSLESLVRIVRTLPRYMFDIGESILGKRMELSFTARLEEQKQSEEKFEKEYIEYFSLESTAFSPYLIYIPGINFIFFLKFFRPGKYRYALPVGQGIALSLLFILGIWYIGWFSASLLSLIWILPGMASVKDRPSLRIPVLYELSAILSWGTFGLIQGTKIAKEKSKTVQEVSYKV